MARLLFLLGLSLSLGCATYEDRVMGNQRALEYSGAMREQCSKNPSDCHCQAAR